MPPEQPGLRERKKAKTRLLISEIATQLFIERGFDAVTVAEVAAAAEVSVATVFNYFETKEDLFFDRDGEILAAQERAVRERKPNESIGSALRRALHVVIDDVWLPPIAAGSARFVGFLRTIEGSPALRARARFGLDKLEATLAEAIAEELHAAKTDPTPRIFAAMVVSIERLLMEEARAAILRGDALDSTKRKLKKTCDRAFGLLEGGAGTYGQQSGRRR